MSLSTVFLGNLSRKETFLQNPSQRLDGSRRRVVFVASTMWNVGRDREVIDRFVIHRELEAFRNEIFWKGLAISAVCEWNGASPDPRRAPKGLAAESSRNPSPSRLISATPLEIVSAKTSQSCPIILNFCHSVDPLVAPYDTKISVKNIFGVLYTFFFIFQIRMHYYFIAPKF